MILYRQRLALGGDRIAWVACGIYPEAISDARLVLSCRRVAARPTTAR
jgi:hypothetical protein